MLLVRQIFVGTMGVMTEKRVLVTGASTGIGAATVRALTDSGWKVLATARRKDRLEKLQAETGCEICVADLTDAADLRKLAEAAASAPLHAVVNNAGGALGVDRVDQADPQRWRRMYEINVMTALEVTNMSLPLIREAGGGSLLFVTSTAALDTYPGGAGYVAAKHAEAMLPRTLRLELLGEPIRVIEVAPGMVATEEFSLNRLGTKEKADEVYEGVDAPLVADDVADGIRFALDAPEHMNVDLMVLRPVAQCSNTQVHRAPLSVRQ